MKFCYHISVKNSTPITYYDKYRGQYDFDDVIQNENSFLSLLSNQIISIKPSGYNITITTIDKNSSGYEGGISGKNSDYSKETK